MFGFFHVPKCAFTHYWFPGAGAGAGLGGYKAKMEAGVDVVREKLALGDKAEFNGNLGVNVNTGIFIMI